MICYSFICHDGGLRLDRSVEYSRGSDAINIVNTKNLHSMIETSTFSPQIIYVTCTKVLVNMVG